MAASAKYQTAEADIWAACRGIDPFRDTAYLNPFSYYSANMEHFLPLVPTDRHLGLFRETLAYERLGALDAERFADGVLPPPAEHGGFLRERLAGGPAVVCTMHTGAQLQVAACLIGAGVPFAVLVSAAAGRQLERSRAFRALRHRPPLMEASRPGVLSAMIGQLRRGSTVLALIDGGEGSLPMHRAGAIRVPFLGQHLFVRAGIPLAAWCAGVPIVPVCAFRGHDGRALLVHGDTLSGRGMARDVFLRLAVNTVYEAFAGSLLHYPAQWTNWWDIQRHIDAGACFRRPDRPPEQLFGLLVEGEKRYAFDRQHYRVLPLPTGTVPLV